MAQWCGRIHIQVKSSSDWNALEHVDVRLLEYVGIYGEMINDFVLRKKRNWINDEVCFSSYGAKDLGSGQILDISFVVQSLAEAFEKKAVIIADATDLNVDPFTVCSYYLGNKVKKLEYNDTSFDGFKYAKMYCKSNIADVGQWLTYGDFRLSSAEIDYLCDFEIGFAVARKNSDANKKSNYVEVSGSALVLSKKGKNYVVKGYNGHHTCIALPEEVDGVKIVGIAAKAFSKKNTLYAREMKSIKLPPTLEFIEKNAFCDCKALEEITIPKCLKRIGEAAFCMCTKLKRVIYEGDVEGWNNIEFAPEFFFGSNPLSVGSDLIINGEPLKKLDIPGNVSVIKDGAFIGGTFETIILDEGVTSIGSRAFQNCENVGVLVLPQSLRIIGHAAFVDCGSLEGLALPNGLETVGDWAFAHCSSLTGVVIPNSVKELASSAFVDCPNLVYTTWNHAKYLGNDQNKYLFWCGVENRDISSLEIHKETKFIAYEAARFCHNLTSVVLPEGVINIGWSAFENCSSLVSIEIPDSVMSIDLSAFKNCSNLTSITIPDGLSSISNSVFEGCLNLISIVFKGTMEQWEDRMRPFAHVKEVICVDGVLDWNEE